MEEERLDIVDEDNNSTGESQRRSVAHREGLWHRTVHIYFFREKAGDIEFLVHLRAKTKDLNPDKWDTRFGGHLKAGESFHEAVTHEVKEETGIELDPRVLLAGEIYKWDNFPNREFTHVYYYRYDGEADALHFDDGEVQTAKWMKTVDIHASIEKDSERWSAGIRGFENIISVLEKVLAQ